MPTKRTVGPFVHWAGGKTHTIRDIDALLPEKLKAGDITNYYEPFVGGGALFFHIATHYKVKRFELNDANSDLIEAYNIVRSDTDRLVEYICNYEDIYNNVDMEGKKKFYYALRSVYNDHDNIKCKTLRAAQFMFLNKTCFNGLYRVNAGGKFNVPFGNRVIAKTVNLDNLYRCGDILRNVCLRFGTYQTEEIRENSFIYYDPPYYSMPGELGFTAYTTTAFNNEDHKELCKRFRELDRPDIYQMLSNSSYNFITELYHGYDMAVVESPRCINCKGEGRTPVPELIIRNYH